MRRVEGTSSIFYRARQFRRYLFGAKEGFIHVFALGGNADVGLEVCNREYILLFEDLATSFELHQSLQESLQQRLLIRCAHCIHAIIRLREAPLMRIGYYD